MKSEALIQSPVAGLAPALTAIPSRIARALGSAVTTMQVGQMASALYQLNDKQLANLGITRAEIPDHARKLIIG